MTELLIASDPQELVDAQRSLIVSVDAKIQLAIKYARESHDMVETMKAARLSIATAKAMHKRATSRVVYLKNIKAALEAGYVMMPDIDGEIIAIRSDRKTPSPAARQHRKGGWRNSVISSVPDERSSGLLAGEGRYISPRQKVDISHARIPGNSGERDEYTAHAVSLCDPDGLHRRFVRPEVISRTAGAMQRRIFDEIVTVRPAQTRHRCSLDPIVLGRIIDKETKRCSAFPVAWFVEPATDI